MTMRKVKIEVQATLSAEISVDDQNKLDPLDVMEAMIEKAQKIIEEDADKAKPRPTFIDKADWSVDFLDTDDITIVGLDGEDLPEGDMEDDDEDDSDEDSDEDENDESEEEDK